MGLFSRKESAAPGGRGRPMISSEAQAAELRARARRRLVGAVALVLAAVVVLPMVLNPEPDRVAADIPIRVPDTQRPFSPTVNSPLAQVDPHTSSGQAGAGVRNGAGGMIAGPDAGGVPPAPPPLSSAMPPDTHTPAPASTVAPPPVTTPPPVASPTPAPRPEPKPASRPELTARSADGERALALLEGREPSPAKPTPRAVEKGNFVLQIASYSARADADGRREKLHAAGVTNAFVQAANIAGKEQFRLRVGPFPSRDAAQAAQARLRTLGYDNGFIAAQ